MLSGFGSSLSTVKVVAILIDLLGILSSRIIFSWLLSEWMEAISRSSNLSYCDRGFDLSIVCRWWPIVAPRFRDRDWECAPVSRVFSPELKPTRRWKPSSKIFRTVGIQAEITPKLTSSWETKMPVVAPSFGDSKHYSLGTYCYKKDGLHDMSPREWADIQSPFNRTHPRTISLFKN